MRKNNPFCLSFGREPDRFVERVEAFERITETFKSESPSINSFLIMGVRGSGKTVLMSSIANYFRDEKDWVVITLNPTRDLLEMFAASLYNDKELKNYYLEASFSIPFLGIGVDAKAKQPINDIQVALEKMISMAHENGKRLLVVIDDIKKSNNIITFATAYQDFISRRLPVYLIMTGLYENIYSLQMAEFTKGYSYAFQALGYIIWEDECTLEEAIPKFDERISEYCYEKIWEDLSETEKKVVISLSENGKQKTKEVIENAISSAKSFSSIRDRLIKKGIIDGSEYGYISLSLPRFSEFVKTKI